MYAADKKTICKYFLPKYFNKNTEVIKYCKVLFEKSVAYKSTYILKHLLSQHMEHIL